MLCVILGDKGAGFSTIFALCSEKGFKLEESRFLFQPLIGLLQVWNVLPVCAYERISSFIDILHLNYMSSLISSPW